MSDEPNREQIIDSLLVTLQRGQNLALRLKFEGKTVQYAELKQKNQKLMREIDEIIEQAMTDWIGNIANLNSEVKTANKRLQAAITSIKADKKKGENIVKAIGLIDDILEIAKAIVP